MSRTLSIHHFVENELAGKAQFHGHLLAPTWQLFLWVLVNNNVYIVKILNLAHLKRTQDATQQESGGNGLYGKNRNINWAYAEPLIMRKSKPTTIH
jgi:hypothetical protein